MTILSIFYTQCLFLCRVKRMIIILNAYAKIICFKLLWSYFLITDSGWCIIMNNKHCGDCQLVNHAPDFKIKSVLHYGLKIK